MRILEDMILISYAEIYSVAVLERTKILVLLVSGFTKEEI